MKKMSRCNVSLLCLISTFLFVGNVSQTYATLVVNPAMPITHNVRVQPIIVSDSNSLGSSAGANPANYFGNGTQQTAILEFIDTIWAQAGIDVMFLTPNTWNSTFANFGANGPPNNGGVPRPTGDLNMIETLSASPPSVRNPDPNVINMFFVNIAAGFPLLGGLQVAGLAETPNSPGGLGNDITMFVGTALLTNPLVIDPEEAIASVVAHEIGHNLSLQHFDLPLTGAAENLMQSGADPFTPGQRLGLDQKADALLSPLATPVPVPSAVWLFASGLIGLVGLKKFRNA